jgi:hypothetical protein
MPGIAELLHHVAHECQLAAEGVEERVVAEAASLSTVGESV